MVDFMESVAGNLQQRIGEVVSRYEADLAILRAQAAKQLEEKDARIKELEQTVRDLAEHLQPTEKHVLAEEADASPAADA